MMDLQLLPQLRLATRFPYNRLGMRVLPVVLVVFLLMLIVIWWPVASKHTGLSEQAASMRTELISVIRLNELSNEYKQARQAVQQVESKLDRVIPLSEFVERLNNLAQQNQVQIISESRNIGKIRSGYLPIYQELNIEADYTSIRRFLAGLSNLPTWTLVQELRLTRQKNTTNLKASLTLVTFQKQTGEAKS